MERIKQRHYCLFEILTPELWEGGVLEQEWGGRNARPPSQVHSAGLTVKSAWNRLTREPNLITRIHMGTMHT